MSAFLADETYPHMVLPRMVYITMPTELGMLYTRQEIEDILAVCRRYDLLLYADGARLGYGLTSSQSDVTLPWFAQHVDAFYIGGTKVGAMFGEAVVFTNTKAPRAFFTTIKRHGALLAKGRMLGLQFDTLFTDDLYMKISRHAIEMAELMRAIFREKGYEFFMETTTNQIFITLTDARKAELERECVLSFWEKPDTDHTVVRFATSWATTEEDIRALEAIL
jgi:threonine aldolase